MSWSHPLKVVTYGWFKLTQAFDCILILRREQNATKDKRVRSGQVVLKKISVAVPVLFLFPFFLTLINIFFIRLRAFNCTSYRLAPIFPYFASSLTASSFISYFILDTSTEPIEAPDFGNLFHLVESNEFCGYEVRFPA